MELARKDEKVRSWSREEETNELGVGTGKN